MVLTMIENFNQLCEMAYGLGQNAQTITQKQFVDLIIDFDNSSKGTRPMSITTVTVPYKRKNAKPYRNIFKVGQVNGFIHGDYGKRVNAQREREGLPPDFKPEPNPRVSEYVSNSIAILTTGNTVLLFHPNLEFKPPSYWFGEVEDGSITEIPQEEAVKYLPAYSGSGRQGVEDAVNYRMYGVNGIIASAFEQQEYQIQNDNPIFNDLFNRVKDRLRS